MNPVSSLRLWLLLSSSVARGFSNDKTSIGRLAFAHQSSYIPVFLNGMEVNVDFVSDNMCLGPEVRGRGFTTAAHSGFFTPYFKILRDSLSLKQLTSSALAEVRTGN